MEQQRPFPYLQLLGIVCASLLVTLILFWVWHVVEFRTMRASHEKQNDALRKDIQILKEYVSRSATSTRNDQSRP
jgi:uncharacterized membrane protein YccC